ncbi:hypothetical protein Bca52824_084248 [Brassica carinata]|uniref:phosphoethanolamine N-methyltransferase n=1 Tax=Brassica carinata TaxID=52824 RepID=A0A8X7PP09_BRACI|nr:hypothetical protein Bca52824_084248 [Brassica carinata]
MASSSVCLTRIVGEESCRSRSFSRCRLNHRRIVAMPYFREEREIQKNYWKEHSVGLSVEAMMLDSKAADLDKEERPEILSLIPRIEGKTVLEFGAGIGRFTSELAQKAGQVIAVDFIDSVIKRFSSPPPHTLQNENINGHYKNVKFMCADVTSPDMKFSDESIDFIFSNWLLMYLSDKEVEDLAKKMLQWTKVGGYIFFRSLAFISLVITSGSTTQHTTGNPSFTQSFSKNAL